MAWIERTQDRNRRSRSYQDDIDASKRAFSGGLTALHYEAELDSGIYDAEIDMTPVRVDVASFDGWRVTANSWHYALGKDIASHGDQDGWVGFGGRQGAHWFKFRLLRVGYLRWSQRAWDDIGGAPTYNRADLSHEPRSRTVGPNDDELIVESVATWANIWTTPGDGALDVSWRVNGDQLKEEIVINQAGREWIVANHPPLWPAVQSYFGFVFELDWSDVPKIVRDSVVLDPDADFSDDDQGIELRDALDRLLAFLPISDLVVRSGGIEVDRTQLRKRFWFDGSNHYLLVGVRCDVLNGMAAGDLVFDPDINPQVAGNDYDAKETANDSGFSSTFLMVRQNPDLWNQVHAAFIFSVTGPGSGDTIDASYLTIKVETAGGRGDDIECDVYCEDVDDSDDFGGTADICNRTKTTAFAPWSALNQGDENWINSPSLNGPVQEVIDRGGWSSGNDLCVICWSGSGTAYVCGVDAYEDSASDAAKLYIEYTAVGPTYTLTAEYGSFTQSGQASGTLFNRLIAALQGSYTLTGQDTGLLLGRLLSADQGSFALTGEAAGLLFNRLLSADNGNYTLTGQDAALLFDRILGAGQGSFTLAGQDTELLLGRLLAADSGTFTLTGQDTALLLGRLLSADQGSFALTGQDAALLYGLILAAEYGSFTLTGQDVGLLYGRILTAAQGSFTLSGQATGLLFNRLLSASQGSFTLSGQSAGLLFGRLLSAAQGSFTLTGIAADLIYSGAGAPDYLLTASQGSFSLTGEDSALLLSRLLTAAQGSFVLTGQATDLLQGRKLSAGQGAFVLTGQDASLLFNRLLSAAQGSFTLTGVAVALTFSGEVVGAVVELQDSETYLVVLTDAAAYVVVLSDSAAYDVVLQDALP